MYSSFTGRIAVADQFTDTEKTCKALDLVISWTCFLALLKGILICEVDADAPGHDEAAKHAKISLET
jgi:hypothetical protein